MKYIQYVDPIYLQDDLEKFKLNKPSDIYSLGVILWELSTGKIPFKKEISNIMKLTNDLINGKRENINLDTPYQYVQVYSGKYNYL